MRVEPTFPTLLERYFTQRLVQQRQASPHTIGSYRDTFRLLLQFVRIPTKLTGCSGGT
jgi:hypothetical protein